MKRSCLDISLIDDNRAVAPLIGFILLFGFLTIAFTGYQAQVVPQQNAETEFEHFQQNHNEMIELRSAILTAGTSDRPQFPTLRLGINYQTRILALNGPDPAGVLQTSNPYPITISDGTEEVVVKTRFVEYQPGYNELDVGSTWYENSVLYLDELESSGGLVVIEDQNLVTDGDRLRITALQNNFQRSGTERITLELYPTSDTGNISQLDDEAELTVELPTRLDADYWDGQFVDTDTVTYNPDDSEFGSELEVNRLNLTVDSVDNLELNTVGIREEPDEEPAKNTDPQTGNGEQEEEENNGGELVSVDDSGADNGQELQFDIRNDGDGEITEITEITIEGDVGDPVESDGQNDEQVEIDTDDPSDQDGELSVGSSEDNQISFDETYDFEEDSQGGAGSYASLGSNNEGTVIIGDFTTDDSDGFERVEVIDEPGQEEDDLLTITLGYEDEAGNEAEAALYLDVEED